MGDRKLGDDVSGGVDLKGTLEAAPRGFSVTRITRVVGLISKELLKQVEDPESDTIWTEGFEARVLEVAFNRARPSFDESTWTLFVDSWIENKSAGQLSAEFQVPVESVYVAKSRSLKRLREEVAILADDFPLLLSSRD